MARFAPRRLRRNARKLIRDIRHRGLGQPWLTVEPRDCFLASFPRSGNTWLRHILYFYLTGAEHVDMTTLDAFCPVIDGVDLKHHLAARATDSHRFIKTHELGAPYFLTGKVALLIRDGRDATWSWHRYRMAFNNASPDFDQFLKACLADRYRYRAWHTNVASWLDLGTHPNLLLLHFEDMRADPAAVFTRVLDHFDIPADPDRIARAVQMATPNKVADTFRSEVRARRAAGDGAGQGGAVQRWRQEYSPEQLRLFEQASGPVLKRAGYPLSTEADPVTPARRA